MPYKKRIVWYKRKVYLDQLFDKGLEFAFVSDDSYQCCPFVLCREYLHEAIYGQLYKTTKIMIRISKPISLSKLQIIIANSSDRNLRRKIPACIDFLHQIEAQLKISKTKVRECADPPKKYAAGGVWFLQGSRRWLKSPPMISLYSLLIRVGFAHTKGKSFINTLQGIFNRKIKPYEKEDYSHIRQSMSGIIRILLEGDRKIFSNDFKKNYPRNLGFYDLHFDLGICAFSDGTYNSVIGKIEN